MLSKRIGLLCLAVVLAISLVACDVETEERADFIGKQVRAWVATEMFIKDRLKAPGTAKFHGGSQDAVYLGDNRYRVVGSVDSQNSFGAMLRTDFQAIVRDEGDKHETWTLEKLETNP